MPSCSQSQTARPVGLCTRTRASLYAPREAGLTDGLFSTTGFTDDLAAEAPPAEAGFSFSPWTNSTASRHNQGSPECVVIADTADLGSTHRYHR